VQPADLRERDERLRPVPGRGDGQLHRQPEGVQRGLLFSVERADLLRAEQRRRALRRPRRWWGELPAAADLRFGDRRDGLRRLSRLDTAELHQHDERLHGRLLLRAGGAGLREGARRPRVRR
jgi:hypothetical protein